MRKERSNEPPRKPRSPSFVGVGDRANAFLSVVAGLAVGVGRELSLGLWFTFKGFNPSAPIRVRDPWRGAECGPIGRATLATEGPRDEGGSTVRAQPPPNSQNASAARGSFGNGKKT